MTSTPAEVLAAVLIDEFARCGVKEACLAPGSRSAPLAHALHEDSRIRLHVRIDERSASFVALGLAKASGTPAVVVSTSGTAAANFYPAVVEAHQSRVPLIVMTADRPPELRGTGANQTIDQTKMFGDAVRWWAEVHSDTYPSAGRHWRSVASHAWQRARGRPRGPVHLNVSLRDPLVGDDEHVPADTSGRPNARPWQTLTDEPVAASDETVERLAARISATERGLIVAGDADIDPDPITSLARTVGWPVLAEPVSGLRSSEMAVSTYDALLRASPWAERHRPDLVIRVGNVGTSKSLLECLQNGVDQILIDADAEWLDATRAVGEIIRCDPSILAAQLLKAVVRREDSRWATSWAAAEVRARHVIDVMLDDENRPTEPRIARDLADLMPPGSTLVVASSMPVRELDSFMRARPGVRIIGNRGASGIDGFVSTAIGVSLASSGPVTALAGDLSILHDAGGLATLGGSTPRLTFVVVNNDGGGIFSFLPQSKRHRSFETLFGTPHGIDFGRLAELYGCDYSLLNTAGDLASIIVERHKGMRIIEARTNRVENVELHRRIWAAVGNEIGTT
jgi:2-succinyl-5-enolpyruvyl-6-hydroxy-3-cyclohexene-1-carboxylate synthase